MWSSRGRTVWRTTYYSSRAYLTRMLIDSHCHLDFPQLKQDLPGLLARAQNAGVGLMVTISTRVAKFDELKEIVAAYDNVFCS
ncbi:MAG: TatD family hydrolase, partial [Pseudomonadota bacterium]